MHARTTYASAAASLEAWLRRRCGPVARTDALPGLLQFSRPRLAVLPIPGQPARPAGLPQRRPRARTSIERCCLDSYEVLLKGCGRARSSLDAGCLW